MYYTGKNSLRILVDPFSIACDRPIDELVTLKLILKYLRVITARYVSIQLVYPQYLEHPKRQINPYAYLPSEDTRFIEDEERPTVRRRTPSREYLEGRKGSYDVGGQAISTEEATIRRLMDAQYLFNIYGLDLLDLYEAEGCDYLLTTNHVLQKEKEFLKDKGCVVVDYMELLSELGIFLKGYNIYIETLSKVPGYGLTADIYYPMTDRELVRYEKLWAEFSKRFKSKEMNEYFRVALFHRYSFLRYAIDQMKYHIQQADRFDDDRIRHYHYFLLSYHLNAFYLCLWGFLDNIAWILNYAYKLGFRETDGSRVRCTFGSPYFRKRMSSIPELASLAADKAVTKWLEELEIKRHPAAHREPIFVSSLYEEESMKRISGTIVVTPTKAGKALYDAVNHIDYDFTELQTFMDKLCKVYGV